MKKLKLGLIVIISIFYCCNFSSCIKDDNVDSSVSILGIWKCYYNEIEGWGVETDNFDYPYMIIDENYLGWSQSPRMPSAQVGGEKYEYTFDEKGMNLILVPIDRSTNQPWDDSEPFAIHITKLNSNEFWFEMDVNGPWELFKYNKYQ